MLFRSDFIDQWVSFDPDAKNQKDDLLDAVEIALGVANVLLPGMPDIVDSIDNSLEAHAAQMIAQAKRKKEIYDPELGDMA